MCERDFIDNQEVTEVGNHNALSGTPPLSAQAPARPLSASFGTISIKSAASLPPPGAGIIVCDRDSARGSLDQDFQEQKCSSAALVPLEIPSKAWPCTFFKSRATHPLGQPMRGGRPPRPQDVHLNRG